MLHCNGTIRNDRRASNQIESDGRLIHNARDPPGQRSVYIPPGDPRKEIYRLSTYKEFPRESPADPRNFAASGFYYTGFKDRVKCFSCGQVAEQWLPGDDVASPLFHTADCDLINGRDTENVPLLAGLRISRNVRSSSNPQSTSNQPIVREQSPVSSFGSTARAAGQVLTPRPSTNITTNVTLPSSLVSSHSSAQYRPQRSSPPPSVVAATRASNTRSPTSSPAPTRRNTSNYDLTALFPCLHPMRPNMQSLQARLQTFNSNPGLWPRHRVRATPQEIAGAGMFFLGERDRTQCWYCNGGLQNWDRDDDPWEEHAKWFPMCEFVLQQKGPEYVHDITARYPTLRRPLLQNPSSVRAPPTLQHTNRTAPSIQVNLSSATSASSSRGPEIVDPMEELRTRNQMIEQEMASSLLVTQARQMGFEGNKIKAAMKKQYELNNQGFSDFESMVDSILSIPEDLSEENVSLPPASSMRSSTSTGSLSSTSEIREMQRLEESRKCKICHNNPAQVVFLPCGHFASCVTCGRTTDTCPVCRSSIRDRVRTYLS